VFGPLLLAVFNWLREIQTRPHGATDAVTTTVFNVSQIVPVVVLVSSVAMQILALANHRAVFRVEITVLTEAFFR
jgi:hypothetical protein